MQKQHKITAIKHFFWGAAIALCLATPARAVPTLVFDGTLDYTSTTGKLRITAELTGYSDLSVTPVLAGSLLSLEALFDSVQVTNLAPGIDQISGNFVTANSNPDISITGGDNADLLTANLNSLTLFGLNITNSGTLNGEITPLAGGLLFDDFTDPSQVIALVLNLDINFNATMFNTDFAGAVTANGTDTGIIAISVPEPGSLALTLPGLLLLGFAAVKNGRQPSFN